MSSTPMSTGRDRTQDTLGRLLADKYDVLQWIGGGGMAEVFLARRRAHGALFAVKVLAEQLSRDPKIVARFTEEARTAATLGGHANIAEIFDIGEGSGLHYLIMPYVEGEDLSSYLERHGRLSNLVALNVVCQITEALVWAGERNVVHRDLKPSNVRIDRSGRAIVLDFGIAKAGDVPSPLTGVGETLGTPYYMSPEQIRGQACDPRSDLYSLGVILFELLSGQKPFTGDTLRAVEIGHTEKLPPALTTLVPDVDPRLEQVVNRLLEKEPARRYQSARELREEWRQISQGQPEVHLEPQVEPLPALVSRTESGDSHGNSNPKRRTWLIPAIMGGLLIASGAAYLAVQNGQQGSADKLPPLKSARAVTLPKMLNDKLGPMFLVPAGKFVFGAGDPESPNPRQEIDLPAFYVDATEVSNRQYAKFVESAHRQAPKSETFKTEPALPVAGVNLADAKSYCAWAGRRVPTEQEWEKAARGVGGNIYPWGNQPLPSPGKLVAVDEYPERQSPFRALNMSGNVFEWTVSPFPVTDREIEDFRKVTGAAEVSHGWGNIKGGSFLLNDERFFRLYMRRGWPVNEASPLLGFRCVKDANQ